MATPVTPWRASEECPLRLRFERHVRPLVGGLRQREGLEAQKGRVHHLGSFGQ